MPPPLPFLLLHRNMRGLGTKVQRPSLPSHACGCTYPASANGFIRAPAKHRLPVRLPPACRHVLGGHLHALPGPHAAAGELQGGGPGGGGRGWEGRGGAPQTPPALPNMQHACVRAFGPSLLPGVRRRSGSASTRTSCAPAGRRPRRLASARGPSAPRRSTQRPYVVGRRRQAGRRIRESCRARPPPQRQHTACCSGTMQTCNTISAPKPPFSTTTPRDPMLCCLAHARPGLAPSLAGRRLGPGPGSGAWCCCC